MSARNLYKAATQGLKEIIAPCPACYNRLKSTQTAVTENPEHKKELADKFELEWEGQIKVFSLLEYLAKLPPDEIKKWVRIDLSKLKLVAYYGCLLVRPPKLVQFDNPEDPTSMDDLLTLVGADMLPWDYKVQCCGAALAISNPKIQHKLGGDILELAAAGGAQGIAVGCPLCHVNLDLRQKQINDSRKTNFNLPIFYFTQILGLAFGFKPHYLEIDKHMVDAMPLLIKTGIIK